ncbi:MAG: FMN-binding protein [Atopostipes sp.]|nr:FMN-binding protein [Atopostipes sp.]
MKKLLTTLTIASALLLTACGGDTEDVEEPVNDTEDTTEEVVEDDGLQDGEYRIEDENFGDNGWKEALEIEVTDGEITDATWESINEDGENKIDDEDYQETMTETDGVGPQDFIPALEDSLLETQNPEDVEVVSGATHTSEKFQDYGEQLMDAAEEGNTETITIDNE